MNKTLQEFLLANSSASQVLVNEGRFVAFGDSPNRDFVRIGRVRGVTGATLYQGVTATDAPPNACVDLYRKVFDLSDPALNASFRLTPWQIKFAQVAIKSINATHFVLFGDEDGVFFNCFDALRFLPEARMNRSHETKVLTHQFKNTSSPKFHMTLNASSVLKLPRLSLDVGIGTNSVVIFSDDKNEDTYLLRDLEVSLPMANFFSDRLGEGISLSLVANSLLQDPGTNQPGSLPLEHDEMDLEHLLDL